MLYSGEFWFVSFFLVFFDVFFSVLCDMYCATFLLLVMMTFDRLDSRSPRLKDHGGDEWEEKKGIGGRDVGGSGVGLGCYRYWWCLDRRDVVRMEGEWVGWSRWEVVKVSG